MEIAYQCCTGLDIHKKDVKACLITSGPGGEIHKEIRTYSTKTENLLQMRDWLKEAGCGHIAMESTGVYWKPVYNMLEGHFELLVVNPQYVKALRGHKTDVKDAAWIADLFRLGMRNRELYSINRAARIAGTDALSHPSGRRASP